MVGIYLYIYSLLLFFSIVGSLVIPVKVKTGNKVKNKKMVPTEIFDKMEADLKEREEENNLLREKV